MKTNEQLLKKSGVPAHIAEEMSRRVERDGCFATALRIFHLGAKERWAVGYGETQEAAQAEANKNAMSELGEIQNA